MTAPTRKWAVTQITAVAALLTMWATTGGWDQEETVGLIGLVAQAAIGYLTPNAGRVSRARVSGQSGQTSPTDALLWLVVLVVVVVVIVVLLRQL